MSRGRPDGIGPGRTANSHPTGDENSRCERACTAQMVVGSAHCRSSSEISSGVLSRAQLQQLGQLLPQARTAGRRGAPGAATLPLEDRSLTAAQRGQQRGQWGNGLDLVGATSCKQHSCIKAQLAGLGQEPALADPRLTFDQDLASTTPLEAVHEGDHHSQLGLTSPERQCDHGPHDATSSKQHQTVSLARSMGPSCCHVLSTVSGPLSRSGRSSFQVRTAINPRLVATISRRRAPGRHSSHGRVRKRRWRRQRWQPSRRTRCHGKCRNQAPSPVRPAAGHHCGRRWES